MEENPDRLASQARTRKSIFYRADGQVGKAGKAGKSDRAARARRRNGWVQRRSESTILSGYYHNVLLADYYAELEYDAEGSA